MQTATLPDPVRDALERFVAGARSAFQDDLRSVIAFGSLAENRLRATSDVNLAVVLTRFEQTRADALREELHLAQAAIQLEVMFLLESEIEDAAAEFAQKFADIQRRHLVLYGSDPFTGLQIDRHALIRRVRQVLLNLTIRLREMYLERSLREEQAAVTVAEAAGPLRTSAAAILELEGTAASSPKEALERLLQTMERPDLVALLPHLSEAREQRKLPPGEGAHWLFLTAQLARSLFERASRL